MSAYDPRHLPHPRSPGNSQQIYLWRNSSNAYMYLTSLTELVSNRAQYKNERMPSCVSISLKGSLRTRKRKVSNRTSNHL